ncbi:hypothetical protein GP486_006317 [Trichoglossum hirsutum]|uniref:Dicer-like protein 2 n=1 Tax=Trichoglossum hirsutum TaxID=265104 RepID=A0A9P8L7G7_9PEZI|nr:hypothetical protein GP486_006317 [Trichoglossum hirsutum]
MDQRQLCTPYEEEHTLASDVMDEDTTLPVGSTLDLMTEGQDGDGEVHATAPELSGGMRPRPYQLEMFDESMKRNIVVTYVWFLAPTVALCQQQHAVICSQLSAFNVLFLSGADHVERWGKQSTWDAALKNVRVVVSTHQVLYDALMHGFVRLKQLALLIFDEAHNCVELHPGNRIMQDFYHPLLRKEGKDCVPHILGMSASPVVNSKPCGLQTIEKNLNSLCRTPRIHRDQLLQHVDTPQIQKLEYLSPAELHVQALDSLKAVYQGLDISEDPYVRSLHVQSTDQSRKELAKVLLKRKTYCRDQIKDLYTKAGHIHEEFGAWATNYFIAHCIDRLRSRSDMGIIADWDDEAKRYLSDTLGRVQVAQVNADSLSDMGEVSPKLQCFVDLLVEESGPHFAGLVFVEQRAAAAVLSHLLSVHPRTKRLFECATFVGASTSSYRKTAKISDLIEPREQKTTLDDFRGGKKNLVIATSVLEEGIDISACHLVICFNGPSTLKSFVQRRGRARAKRSKFVLMVGGKGRNNSVARWQELEEIMKEMYLDDERKLEETGRESVVEEGDRRFLVESTGALLTLESAVGHLFHFCNRLTRAQYVDLRPAFSITEDPVTRLVRATVTLPSSVGSSVGRVAGGEWHTERMAKKDAAFEMYVALYKAGLVNDNLLPQPRDNEEELVETDRRPSIKSVPEQFNPWIPLARKWSETCDLHISTIEVTDGENNDKLQMELILPLRLPPVPEFSLHWSKDAYVRVSIGPPVRVVSPSAGERHAMRRMTWIILRSVFQSRMKSNEMDFPALFMPCGETNYVDYWADVQEATDVFAGHPFGHDYGLVQDRTRSYKAHIFKEWTIEAPPLTDIRSKAEEGGSSGGLFARVTPVTKRRDFLHAINVSGKSSTDASNDTPKSSKSELLPAGDCVINNLPFVYSRFALFIPSILHRIEVALVADELRKTIVAPVDIQDLNLVITAISASSAREGASYQRLEFLGDSILKLCTSVQLLAKHPDWHEGYLSSRKDLTISNSRLAQATDKTGLHKFILTKPFTGLKWNPLYVSDLLKEQEGGDARRNMSTKVSADVIEALIGASFVDGGFEKAIRCLECFLPEIRWQSHQHSNHLLYEAAKLDVPMPPHFVDLERLIGYNFTKKGLLVEAMTHPSFEANSYSTSYQRLEFLGDSVLDHIVVSRLFGHRGELPELQMHLARTALVNADFLAFLCIELAIEIDINVIEKDERTNGFREVGKKVPKQVWKFMKHHCSDITRAQEACLQRHARLRDEIWHALTSENPYPWAKLRHLEANKFFSDITESIVGAIYVDSHGDFSACERMVERLGVISYLDRILDDSSGGGGRTARLLHPKEWLGQLADQDKVKYIVRLEAEEDSEEKDPLDTRPRKRRHICKVLVKDEEVAVVGGGTSREEVETRAAEVAAKVLLERRGKNGD